MRYVISVLAIALALSIMVVEGHAQQVLSHETATAGGIMATIKVTAYPDRGNMLVLAVDWKSAPHVNYPMGCLFVARDLHFEMKDSSGHAIPIDQQKIESLEDSGPGVLNHMTTTRPLTCAQRQAHESRINLRGLQPNLPKGRYTLEVTLAPRGLSQRSQFAPIQLTL